MKWDPKDSLSEEELKRGLHGVTLDGLATRVTVTLASGAFLVAFALKLGASNAVIGFLAAIPFITYILQLPTVFLIEKLQVRRPISVVAALASRSTLLVIALIPFFAPEGWGVWILVAALLVKGAFGAVSQCAWSAWMRDLIPKTERGGFYAKRMSLAAALGMVTALVAGVYLDWFKKGFGQYEAYGYSLLFVIAFVVGLMNVWFIYRIPEPRMTSKGVNVFQLMLEPFRDENFRKLMKFLVSWQFAINLAAPFFTVYMLTAIKLDMSTVVALTVVSQIANILVIRIWGRFMDRFTNKAVLRVCGPLYIVCIFMWIFTMHPTPHMLTMPLLVVLHVLMGVATAGTVLGTSNIAIRLAPKDAASSYLATSSIANSIAAAIAPILGGSFADYFADRKFTLIMTWTGPDTNVSVQAFKLTHWDFFFFFAFLIGMISIYLLGKVEERGEVGRRVVLHEFALELGRNARTLSTVGGMIQITRFPMDFIKNKLNNGKKA